MDATNLIARRSFLRGGLSGLGLFGLNSLLRGQGVVNPLHHAPKAKRVIFLYQAGGPSHLETFDYKPKLAEMHGKGMPESMTKGQQIAQLQGRPLICFGPQFGFKKFGKSGQEMCELFPHMGSVADDVCIVRSMWTEQINHDPAHTIMNTGSIIPGRPSMGSWVLYGLGARDAGSAGLRRAAVGRTRRADAADRRAPMVGRAAAGQFQGVKLNSAGDPVLHIQNPPGLSAKMQRDSVDAINRLNRLEDATLHDPEIQTRIAQYEMAFRMQTSVPGLVDMSKEPQSVLDAYGAQPGDGSFASNCLLARRLAERGVRFIQLYHRDWDHHGDVEARRHPEGRRSRSSDGRAHQRPQAARHAR